VTRRVFHALVECSEIARAFRNLVAIGASPDPAVVVALKKIPDQFVPPFGLPSTAELRALSALWCAIVA
jgi:hypothetical protein